MKNTPKIMAIDTLDSYENLHITCDYPQITSIEENLLSFKVGCTEISLLFNSEYAINILKNALVTMSENIEAKQKPDFEDVEIVEKNKKDGNGIKGMKWGIRNDKKETENDN